jgi:hypothetical protein
MSHCHLEVGRPAGNPCQLPLLRRSASQSVCGGAFVFDLQKKGQEPRRSASTRFTHNLNPRYHGEDTALVGPAFTSYARFNQAGPSMVHHPGHDAW